MKSFFKHIVVGILTFEAKILLKRMRPKVVAVTGSVGKTSTKDAIYEALKDSVYARKSQKSYNSELGVPLSILGLENAWSNPILWVKNIFDGLFRALLVQEYPDVLVLEMGVDRPGDMKRLMTWIQPDVVVLTRLPDVPVHVEYFRDGEQVIQEKLELVRHLKPEGILIFNNDDERARQEAEQVRQKSYGYSRYSPSAFTLSNDEIIFEDRLPVGMRSTLTHNDESVTLTVHGSLGVQHAYSYAAACAVARQYFDIPLEQSASALAAGFPPPGRMRILPGINKMLIIDDSYNSSPTAAERALLTLKELNLFGQRKVAVLGDMLELGRYSSAEHERIGALAATVVDVLITVGVRSRKTAEGALENGLSEKSIYQYETIEAAISEMPKLLEYGDTVLVKGSQGIRAEKLVAMLLEDRSTARKVLVRQDSMWEKK